METNKEKITIEVITRMYSCGADKKEAEFRLTELKSAMRYWWRACNYFTTVSDMKEEEKEHFGSIENISPFILRYNENPTLGTEKKREYKYINEFAIKFHEEVTFLLQMRDDAKYPIEKYKNILELASILGGIGRFSRKGQGVFWIKGAKLFANEKELAKRVEELLRSVGEEQQEFHCNKKETYVSLKACLQRRMEDCSYPYIEEILIGKPIRSSDFYYNRKNILDNRSDNNAKFNFKGGRYACPVYMTYYPCMDKEKIDENREQNSSLSITRLFPILVFLKNTSINFEKEPGKYTAFKNNCINHMFNNDGYKERGNKNGNRKK